LRVTVSEWEPGTLDLHHGAVSATEGMEEIRHIEVMSVIFAGTISD
jgi:hypothetical protein